MRLADLIKTETGEDYEGIMFLRHSNGRTDRCNSYGVSLDELTALKSTRDQYDYWKYETGRINIVVAVVRDRVHAVYKIVGIKHASGMLFSLASDGYAKLLCDTDEPDRPARVYEIKKVASRAIGAVVTGWEGRERTAACRSKSTFYFNLAVADRDLRPN